MGPACSLTADRTELAVVEEQDLPCAGDRLPAACMTLTAPRKASGIWPISEARYTSAWPSKLSRGWTLCASNMMCCRAGFKFSGRLTIPRAGWLCCCVGHLTDRPK